mmetsp:Transcript_10466/g.25289  ORF Transcript_10466/g.25289 Transcript_10466/m.25289 type:complete len:253 (-) Transcript_10466:291-1049(-)
MAKGKMMAFVPKQDGSLKTSLPLRPEGEVDLAKLEWHIAAKVVAYLWCCCNHSRTTIPAQTPHKMRLCPLIVARLEQLPLLPLKTFQHHQMNCEPWQVELRKTAGYLSASFVEPLPGQSIGAVPGSPPLVHRFASNSKISKSTPHRDQDCSVSKLASVVPFFRKKDLIRGYCQAQSQDSLSSQIAPSGYLKDPMAYLMTIPAASALYPQACEDSHSNFPIAERRTQMTSPRIPNKRLEEKCHANLKDRPTLH